MDRAVRRSELTFFSRVGEVRDRSLGPYENQLAKFLELFDPLFKDVLHTIDPWDSSAALQSTGRIRREQFGSSSCRDASGIGQAFSEESISSHQDRGSQTGLEHGGCFLDRLGGRQRRFWQEGHGRNRAAFAPGHIGG